MMAEDHSKRIGLLLDVRPELLCDNMQTLRVIKEPGGRINTKMRHVDIQQCWLREQHLAGNIAVNWIPTASMPADGMTKLLPALKHKTFLTQLRLVTSPESVRQIPNSSTESVPLSGGENDN